jgi:bacteriocin biosynthesis cyclodehydratase domain-containing protein
VDDGRALASARYARLLPAVHVAADDDGVGFELDGVRLRLPGAHAVAAWRRLAGSDVTPERALPGRSTDPALWQLLDLLVAHRFAVASARPLPADPARDFVAWAGGAPRAGVPGLGVVWEFAGSLPEPDDADGLVRVSRWGGLQDGVDALTAPGAGSRPDMVLCVVPTGRDRAVGPLAEALRAAAVPWLPVRVGSRHVWLGPTVVPEGSVCWDCASRRIESNQNYPPVPGARSRVPNVVLRLAAAEGVLECVRHLHSLAAPSFVNRLAEYDVATGTRRTHPVLPVPDCAHCTWASVPHQEEESPWPTRWTFTAGR